jgi:hypothetical protein
MSRFSPAAPPASLSVVDVVSMLVGIVIGVGIFKAPSLVAANVGSEAAFVGHWLLGGVHPPVPRARPARNPRLPGRGSLFSR